MSNPNTIDPIEGLLPVKKIKQLPGDMITHMPFIIFKPMEVQIGGKNYTPMVFLYFSRNLQIAPDYPDGYAFDSMPTDNQLSFSATFDKSVKYTVLKNTYYFATDLAKDRLAFIMKMSQDTVNKYNAANPTNPINGHFPTEGEDSSTIHPVQFINAECDVIIPPFPPS